MPLTSDVEGKIRTRSFFSRRISFVKETDIVIPAQFHPAKKHFGMEIVSMLELIFGIFTLNSSPTT